MLSPSECALRNASGSSSSPSPARMVLVLDAPGAVDLAKADGQPKLEAAWHGRTTDCGRPQRIWRPQRRRCRRRIFVALRRRRLAHVGDRRRTDPRSSCIPPCARLQRRRHVEHDDVVIVMCQYSRQVMTPDGVCPSFDQCLDLGFSGSSSLRHDPCSHELPIHAPRTNEALQSDTGSQIFESTGGGPSGPLQLLRPKPADAPKVPFLRWPSPKRPGRFPPLATRLRHLASSFLPPDCSERARTLNPSASRPRFAGEIAVPPPLPPA